MKKLLVAILLLSGFAFAQAPSRVSGPLTASCSNTNSSCSGTVGSSVEIATNYYNLVLVTVNGTYAGVTAAFEISDDGVTWYPNLCARNDSNLQEASEILPSNQTRAFLCDVESAVRFRVRASAWSSGTVNVGLTASLISIEPAATVQQSITGTAGSNPCSNPHQALVTAVIAMSTTSLTTAVSNVAGQRLYICSFMVSNATATATLQLEYGSGSNCGSGTTSLMGPFTIPQSTAAPLVVNMPIAPLPAANNFCYILTGSTPTGTLTLNYISQ